MRARNRRREKRARLARWILAPLFAPEATRTLGQMLEKDEMYIYANYLVPVMPFDWSTVVRGDF